MKDADRKRRLRFMWDYGVRVPLWSDGVLLPEDPEWLRTTLGLSDVLIRELSLWCRAMEERGWATDEWDASGRTDEEAAGLERSGRALFARVQQELGPRIVVDYHPWT